MGQAVEEERQKPLGTQVLPAFFLDCLTLDDGIDRLTRNVGTKLPFYAA